MKAIYHDDTKKKKKKKKTLYEPRHPPGTQAVELNAVGPASPIRYFPPLGIPVLSGTVFANQTGGKSPTALWSRSLWAHSFRKSPLGRPRKIASW